MVKRQNKEESKKQDKDNKMKEKTKQEQTQEPLRQIDTTSNKGAKEESKNPLMIQGLEHNDLMEQNIPGAEKDTLLDKLSNIIKDKKSEILGREIVIADVQGALLNNYKEYYSEEKLLKYQKIVNELTEKQKNGVLTKPDSSKLSNHIKYLREQEYVKEMLDILEQAHISKADAAKVLLPFADPTLDVSFKMLFGQDENKDILISLLNSLLDFKEKDTIIELTINPNELVVSNISHKKGDTGISSAVDILCTTNDGRQIAIEIQGQKTNYFLTREQEYMAKLIYGQVKEGQGNAYHDKVIDTYILVIGKENMFIGNTELKGVVLNSPHLQPQQLFELDVEPRVRQTGEIVPGNKMHWKFFELPKFKTSDQYVKIKEYDKLSEESEQPLLAERFEWLNNNLKEQWLEFLIECNSQTKIPNRNELIKKGYNIMKLTTWDPLDRVLLWKQKQNEIDAQQQKLFDKEEAEKIGFEKGKLEGKLEGKIKGEIDKVKFGIENELAKDKITQKLQFLPQDSYEYIKNHMDDSASQIFQDHYQDLVGDVNINF